ncbi:MAG: 3'-5'-exoribonuclease [Marteilia pararefringens]
MNSLNNKAASFHLKSMPKCQERFIKDLLLQNSYFCVESEGEKFKYYRRIDLRDSDQIRELRILQFIPPSISQDFSLEEYSTQIILALGESVVKSTISVSIIKPKENNVTRGSCKFQIDFDKNANYVQNLTSESIILLQRSIEKTFIKSNAINLDSLCIISEHAVWKLSINLEILANHGNILDLCSFSSLISLSTLKLPQVNIVDQNKGIFKIIHPNKAIPEKIILNHKPLSITFAIYNHPKLGHLYLIDPNEYEEILADGNVSISINNMRDICSFMINGSVNFRSIESMNDAIEMASIQYVKVIDKVRNFIEKIEGSENETCDSDLLQPKLDKLYEKTGSKDDNNKFTEIIRYLIQESKISPYEKIRRASKNSDNISAKNVDQLTPMIDQDSLSYSSYDEDDL